MITTKEVEYAANLARLELSEEEKEKYTGQFSKILEHFNLLKEADTTEVEPMAHVLPVKNVMREDQAELTHNRSEILQNAPLEEDGYFKVPKI